MSKQLEPREAEAVLMLRGAHEGAFNVLISYFKRRYDFARDQCVDVDDDKKMKREQGKARAFKEISNIEKNAENVLEAIRSD